MHSVPFKPAFRKSPFEQFHRAFLDDPSLPFAKVLPAETVELTFKKYDALFGGTFYNTAVVLWAFLSQVLADGKSRSCSAAVSRIAAFFIALGKKPPSSNTGDYCNARLELSLKALEELAVLVAKNTETIVKPEWLWGCKSKKGNVFDALFAKRSPTRSRDKRVGDIRGEIRCRRERLFV